MTEVPVTVGPRWRGRRSVVEREPAPWPGATLLGPLVALALVLALVELGDPPWSGHVGPLALAVATGAVAFRALHGSRPLEPEARSLRRAVSLILGLLAVGQLLRGLAGVGVNPISAGLSDLPLAATGPATLLLCIHLVRSNGGRLRAQVALDASVAQLALAVLVGVLVPAARTPAGAGHPLLIAGYPAVSAMLIAVGLVTVAGVGPARRAAAGWLLLCLSALAVAMVSGSFAAISPSPVLDAVTSVAYLAMLGCAAAAVGRYPSTRTAGEQPAVTPLAGVVISYCLAFGVVLLLLVGWSVGRPVSVVEGVATAVLLVLTLVRTLLWAADAARLTRQVLRAEAYFRTLVHSAADITIVLDSDARITWDSGAGHHPHGWTARDLGGRPLTDFVHEEDRGELLAALAAGGDPDQGRGRVFRLRSRDGRWPAYETVRVVPSGVFQAGPGEVPATGDAGLVLHLRDVDDRRQNELELERMAYTDYLTGLPNRARLMAALTGARSRAAEGEPGCVLLLDLDGFKAVNDVAGHEAGDLVLVEVADRLRATVRDQDLVGRLGGDEFAVVVRGTLDEATGLAERIISELAGVQRSVPTAGTDPDLVFDVSCSIGVTELNPGEAVPTAVRNADLALRAAKAAGKGCVRWHGETADSVTRRRTRLARDLPDALGHGQLRLVYQPVVGTAERRVLGLEALVRWDHPLLGEVSPEEFIPLAEDDGLIVPLQRWVLETATAELAGLLRQGRDLQLGVNISVRHLQSGSLVPDVAAALAKAGLPPKRLMLEVTESLFIGEPDRADGDLQTLHDMGCVISLDDFGRGYSTFAYLARLPVDVLKMDREFLATISDDPRSAALVHSVIDLGRRLSIDVVAEGVETPGQLAALRGLGCRFLQGFLFAPPTRPELLAEVIDGFDPRILDDQLPLPELAVPVGE